MRFSGGVWTVVPMPKNDHSADLFGVSCPSHRLVHGGGPGLGIEADGQRRVYPRQVANGPQPGDQGASLAAAERRSTAPPALLHGGGKHRTDFGSTLHGELVTALYNGSFWRLVPVPISFPRTLPSLNGVSCARDGECIAVGNRNFYTASPGRQLIIRYRAGHWSVMNALRLPKPSPCRSRALHRAPALRLA